MKILSAIMLLVSSAAIVACGNSSTTNSTSTNTESVSEVAAATISGSANSSDTNASAVAQMSVPTHSSLVASLQRLLEPLIEPLAVGSTACPVAPFGKTSTGTTNPSNVITLSYSNCTAFGALSGATLPSWNGSQILTFDTSATLTAYSAGTATSGSVTRTFSGGIGSTTGTISSSTPTYRTGLTVTPVVYVDTTTSDIVCYPSSTGCPTLGGVTTTFGSGTRTMTINGLRIVGAASTSSTATSFDHTVTTPAAITISGQGATKSIASGSVTVFHNILRYKATATLSNLQWTTTGCNPTSGTITTSCPSGTTNANEVLTFSGGNSAQLVSCNNATTTVTLGHCF